MYVETLTPAAHELLKTLGRLEFPATFYLAGGTAVALHLGHRISVDLDFFTHGESYDAVALLNTLRSVGTLNVRQQSAGTLIGTLCRVQVLHDRLSVPRALLHR